MSAHDHGQIPTLMKTVIKSLPALLSAGLILCQAADTTPPTATPPPPRAGRGGPNSNDLFYALGPDSKHMEGVPQGKFLGPRIIPSNVFPGTQHTYWVYVPAQYDPTKPTAVMIFNDGQ